MRLLALLATLSLYPILYTFAQDGSINGPGTDPQAAGYSCDTSKCKLPNCRCAGTDIPGGIPQGQTPMFLIFTA